MAAKLTKKQVAEIRRRVDRGEMRIRLAEEFGISRQQVTRIMLRQDWKDGECGKSGRPFRYPHANWPKLIERMATESMLDIAASAGVSKSSLHWALKKSKYWKGNIPKSRDAIQRDIKRRSS